MGFTSLCLGPLTKPLLCRNSTCMCCGQKGCLAGRKMLSRSCFPMGFSSLSHAQNACVNEEIVKDKLLIDCGSDQECVLGGIVALGKFEALHRGHRELAIQASKAGTPFLLSFIGMAEVLGWVHKEPIVAKCDRKRVLASWAPHCGNVVPLEYHVDFSRVRHLSPRQFVEKLSDELGITGVVAGENYRFGYKAAGDASELVRLCNEYGLHSYIVKSVMDKLQHCNGASTTNNGKEKGQISSTRVRHALSLGDMDYVAELLGRKHRLVMTNNEGHVSQGSLSLPFMCLMNQPPKEGSYENCTLYVDGFVGVCDVVIDATHIHVSMDSWPPLTANCLISIEFSGSASRGD